MCSQGVTIPTHSGDGADELVRVPPWLAAGGYVEFVAGSLDEHDIVVLPGRVAVGAR